MEIRVLGAWCARCKKLCEDVKKAVEQAGLGATVEYVSDISEIMKYDVLMTPALVINGEVKAAGRVPCIPEMVLWFISAAAKSARSIAVMSSMNTSVREPGDEPARDLGAILGLRTDPVVVFLLPPGPVAVEWNGAARLKGLRWCQALMRARHGELVLLDAKGIACPAAAAAFGFRPLPVGLANGSGLIGFGIVRDQALSRVMSWGIRRLAPGSVGTLAACPLQLAPRTLDVVVLQGSPEVLMWVALADLNAAWVARRHGDTAVLQTTCVDAVVIPHVGQQLNFGLWLLRLQRSHGPGTGRGRLGLPELAAVGDRGGIVRPGQKAVPRSRTKAVHQHLGRFSDCDQVERLPAEVEYEQQEGSFRCPARVRGGRHWLPGPEGDAQKRHRKAGRVRGDDFGRDGGKRARRCYRGPSRPA